MSLFFPIFRKTKTAFQNLSKYQKKIKFIHSSSVCIAQNRRAFSSSETEKSSETVELTTDLEKKLHADVEALTTQNQTLEEKNKELLVRLTLNNRKFFNRKFYRMIRINTNAH